MSASTSSLSIHSSYDNSNNSNIASLSSQQKQQLQLQQQSTSLTPSLTSLLHQKLTTNNNNDHQQKKASSKQVLLNDIASGLADAVAVAVSDAVSSVQQKKCNNLLQQSIQQNQPPSEHQHSEQTTFSHLRHQLESKDQQQHALRKNLTNINIEVAVASAVNRYLTSTINKNYRENEIEQVNDNKVISLHV